jgi:pyruvate dehydrogenase (quinone)
VPVVAIVGQTERSAMGGSYQQEVDLQALFADVASEYLVEVNVPEQLPNAIDRAFRTALARRAPTAIIIPSDLQTEPYSPPKHAFKQVPSSPPPLHAPTIVADPAELARAAEVLNAGSGRDPGRPGAHAVRPMRVAQVADVLGAGVAKALLGKDVLSDELPFGHRVDRDPRLRAPTYEMMRDCDTLLIVGSNMPYSQFLPEFGNARAVQVDLDGTMIGMRYPIEVNLVGDAAATLAALLPLLSGPTDRAASKKWREKIEEDVAAGGRPCAGSRWSTPTRSTRCGSSGS